MEKVPCVTDPVRQRWFAKSRAGGFSLHHAPPPGRTGDVDSDQIEILIENNQCDATWEIADMFQIFKSIKLLVKMKNVSLFYGKH